MGRGGVLLALIAFAIYAEATCPAGLSGASCELSTCNAPISNLMCSARGNCTTIEAGSPSTSLPSRFIGMPLVIHNFHGQFLQVSVGGVLSMNITAKTGLQQWRLSALGGPSQVSIQNVGPPFYALHPLSDLATITTTASTSASDWFSLSQSPTPPGYNLLTSFSRYMSQNPTGAVSQGTNTAQWETFRFEVFQCACQAGYAGVTCEQTTCTSNDTTGAICSGHGACNNAVCVCDFGFTGTVCQTTTCNTPSTGVCNGHGTCTSNVCACATGFNGPLCFPNTCPLGFSGPTCSTRVCANPTLGTCSGQGSCDAINQRCTCFTVSGGGGYTGATCEVFWPTAYHVGLVGSTDCSGTDPFFWPPTLPYTPNVHACSGAGFCNASSCLCILNRSGFNCSTITGCYGGDYTPPSTCACRSGYRGAQCEFFTSATGSCFDDNFVECGGKGRCDANQLSTGLTPSDGVCVNCGTNYGGLRCSVVQSCAVGGAFSGGVCACRAGFTGPACEYDGCWNDARTVRTVNSTCGAVTCNNPATNILCSGGGTCDTSTSSVCVCTPQFSGAYCEIRNLCLDAQNVTCSNHGVCPGAVCVCNPGWTGQLCNLHTCSNNATVNATVCSSVGVCNATSATCMCPPTTIGLLCEQPHTYCGNQVGYGVVDTTSQACSVHGFCSPLVSNTAIWQCVCDPGFYSINCSVSSLCVPRPGAPTCSGNGYCLDTGNHQAASCVCSQGFFGANCSIAACYDWQVCAPVNLPPCYNRDGTVCGIRNVTHGVCQSQSGSYACHCDSLWSGSTCQNPLSCNGHGTPVVGAACVCNRGWDGIACDVQCPTGFTGFNCSLGACADVRCGPHATGCVGNGVCVCASGYDGSNCTAQNNATQCYSTGECPCTTDLNGAACLLQFRGAQCFSTGRLCGNHGTSVGHGVCTYEAGVTDVPNQCVCASGWYGEFCDSRASCRGIDSNNPITPVNGVCVCPSANNNNQYGDECELLHCYNGGVWNGVTCACPSNFYLSDCSASRCANSTSGLVCGGVGVCNNSTGDCYCPLQFGSPRCERAIPQCEEGYTGGNCSTRTCVNPLTGVACSGRGVCASGGICQCGAMALGPTCRLVRPSCNLANAVAITCTSGLYNATTLNSSFDGLTRLVQCNTLACVCNINTSHVDADCFSLTPNGTCSGHGRHASSDGASTTCACSQADVLNECGDGSAVSVAHCNAATGSCLCDPLTTQVVCDEGHTGINCSVPTCVNPLTGEICSTAGVCTAGVCACDRTRYGPTCRGTRTPQPPASCLAGVSSICQSIPNGACADSECESSLNQGVFDSCTIADIPNNFQWCYTPNPTNGYCNWDNTVGINCTLGVVATVHNVRLLDCITPPTCVCKSSLPYRRYGPSCSENICMFATNLCRRDNSSRCPLAGCSDCSAFGAPTGIPPISPFAGKWCCPVFADVAHTSMTVCGGRGVCGGDSQCQCDAGFGGQYCCPRTTDQGSACGIHGTCLSDGTCACNHGWSGSACEVDPGCGGCGGGVCLVGNHIHELLAQLRMDLKTRTDLPASFLGSSSFYISDSSVATVPLYLNSSNPIDPLTFAASNDSLQTEALYNAVLVRETFLGMDLHSPSIPINRYLVDCGIDRINASTSLYDSILGLSPLGVYRSVWRTNGATDVLTVVGNIFTQRYPSVSVDATYVAQVVAMINDPQATDESVAYALSAILVYEVLQDENGVVVFPLPTGFARCMCGVAGGEPHCANVCPMGLDGQLCSGFAGGIHRGSCTSTGECLCRTTRRGFACEIDVVGACVASSLPGQPLCSAHGACAPASNSSYACTCDVGWTGTYCDISVCSEWVVPQPTDPTIECSNFGNCPASGVCACQVAAYLSLSSLQSVPPILPVGDLCEIDGSLACATFHTNTQPHWSQCNNHGVCMPAQCTNCNSSDPRIIPGSNAFCVCDNGFGGAQCNISLCGTPGCNSNERCNEATGVCVCHSKYSTPTGTCLSGDISCRCNTSLCQHGNVTGNGDMCACESHYRTDSNGFCSIVQCPYVLITDAGQVQCNDTSRRCNSTEQSHRDRCCYDACTTSGGATACTLVSSAPVCACDPSAGFNQIGGVCFSKCSGHPFTVTGLSTVHCNCDPTFPLFPPFDPLHEYLTLASCARVSCLNGGTVASSGQSCVCPAFLSGPLCATLTCPANLLVRTTPIASCVALDCSVNSTVRANCTACQHGRPTIVQSAIVCNCSLSGFNGTFCENPIASASIISSSSSTGGAGSSSSSSSSGGGTGSSTTMVNSSSARHSSSSSSSFVSASSTAGSVHNPSSSSSSLTSHTLSTTIATGMHSSTGGSTSSHSSSSSTGVSTAVSSTTARTINVWVLAGAVVGAVAGVFLVTVVVSACSAAPAAGYMDV